MSKITWLRRSSSKTRNQDCLTAKPVLFCCVILPFCKFVWKIITFLLHLWSRLLSYLFDRYLLSAHHVSDTLRTMEVTEIHSSSLKNSHLSRGDKTDIPLYTHVHSSIIHNSQKVEATQVSINRCMGKQNVECTCNGIVNNHSMYSALNVVQSWIALKKKEIMTHATTWMNLEDITLCDINQTQVDKYCMILLIWST